MKKMVLSNAFAIFLATIVMLIALSLVAKPSEGAAIGVYFLDPLANVSNGTTPLPIQLMHNHFNHSTYNATGTAYRITVNVTDPDGRVSLLPSFNVTVTAVNNDTGTTTILGNMTNITSLILSAGTILYNVTMYTITIDTTALTDGNYTLNVTVSNFSSGSLAGNSTRMRIDNTGPRITTLHPGSTPFLKKTSAVNFTFSVNDVMAPIFNCTLFLDRTNSTGGGILAMYTSITNNTVISTVNATMVEGTHSFTLHCQDSDRLNNTASTGNNSFFIDNTSPEISITFLDSQLNPQTTFSATDTLTIQCARKDPIASYNRTEILIKTPGLTAFKSLIIDPLIDSLQKVLEFDLESADTEELGDYQVQCVSIDRAGNENTTTGSFTVDIKAPPSTSAFAVPGFANPVGKTKISEGSTKDAGALTETPSSWLMATGASIKFSINGQEHSVSVKDATADSVTLTIQSSVKEVKIDKGESKVIDVDDDGTGDIEITYHKLFKKTADITFKVTSAPPSPIEEGEVTGPSAPGEQVGEGMPPAKKSAAGLWITILVIVIIVVIGYVVIKGKKR